MKCKSNWRIGSATISILGVLSLVSPVKAQLIDRPPFFRDGYNQMQEEIQRLENQQQQQQPEIPSGLLTVDDGELHWQKFIFRDAGFSVWMPQGTQGEQTHVLETTAGELSFEITATYPLTWQFLAAYSDKIDPTQLNDSEKLFASIRDSIVRETQFQLAEEKVISLEQYPGRQLVLKDEDEIFTFKMYLVDRRVYILAARKSDSKERAEDVTHFFDSFRLLK